MAAICILKSLPRYFAFKSNKGYKFKQKIVILKAPCHHLGL
jgi:hypothetical protein